MGHVATELLIDLVPSQDGSGWKTETCLRVKDQIQISTKDQLGSEKGLTEETSVIKQGCTSKARAKQAPWGITNSREKSEESQKTRPMG